MIWHPDSHVVNIASPAGTISNWNRNLSKIANLAATGIARTMERGEGSVLLVRKNADKEEGKNYQNQAVDAVQTALGRLGLSQVEFPDWADAASSANPDPMTVPVLTYGAIGVNKLEHYQFLMATCAFYVPVEVLSNNLQDHLPPSERRPLTIEAGRQIRIGGRRLQPAQQAVMETALFRLEVDTLLQAVFRVRPATSPATIVLSCYHDLSPYVGRLTRVRTFEEARRALGWGSFKQERRRRLTEQLIRGIEQGRPQHEVAAQLNVSDSSATRWLADYRNDRNRGMP